MCKELDLDLFNLLDDVGLYEVDFDKLYYVMFKSKNENIFKIHARCEGEAMRIALDFVMEKDGKLRIIENTLPACALILKKAQMPDPDKLKILDYMQRASTVPKEFEEFNE